MKILLGSHHFYPSTGGIEIVSDLLAREFVRRGHDVRVVTQTPGNSTFPFPVIRRPGALQLIRLVRWCDVFLQNNISLRTVWPLAFIRRPLFVTQQTWISAPGAPSSWRDALKRAVLRRATCFAISGAIARDAAVPCLPVGNPYNDQVFRRDPTAERRLELIFVGRLVSDKGVDVLLEALRLLQERGVRPKLTIVGDGPEAQMLQQQAERLNLAEQVTFLGAKRSEQIATLLNQHEIAIVPSRLAEPFGIVAVEAIACGCVVIGSAAGGLVEAIGPCGLTFPNGDAAMLAERIAELLTSPQRRSELRAASGPHLAQFTVARVADIYLERMAAALR